MSDPEPYEFGYAPKDEPAEPPPAAAGAPRPPSGTACHWHGTEQAEALCAACDVPICYLCASRIEQPGAPPGSSVCPTCAPAYGLPSSIPFEDPALGGWMGFWRTFGWVFGKPGQLWRAFPPAPLGRAVIFAYLAALPMALLATCLQMVMATVQARMGGGFAGNDPFAQALQERLGMDPQTLALLNATTPFIAYIFTPVWLFFWTVFHHIPAAMMGSRARFGTTFRVVCYLAPLQIFDVLCAPVRWVWHTVLMVQAMQRIHGLSTGRAVVAAVTPLALMLLACCGMVILFISVIVSLTGGGAAIAPPTPAGG